MQILLARASSSGRPRPFLWLAGGLLIAALVLATGLNRNLLYLSLVFGVYLIVATTARSPAVVAAGLLFAALVAVRPVTVPNVGFHAPVWGGREYAREYTLRDGETLNYRFFLRGVKPLADARGRVVGGLHVDGRSLADLQVSIGRVERSDQVRRIQKYDYEEAWLPIEIMGDQVLSVTLCARPGTKPGILVAPEVDGRRVYPLAVYIEIGTPRRSLTFHARPDEAPPGVS